MIQRTLFGKSKREIILDFLNPYLPILEKLKEPHEFSKEEIRTLLKKEKKKALLKRNEKMYRKEDCEITAEELMNGKIKVDKILSNQYFLEEYNRTSMNRANAYPGQKPYLITCNNKKIGLLTLSVPLFSIRQRNETGIDLSEHSGYNIQICVSYPWAAPFLTGKLLASIGCAMSYEERMDFVETTSLYGKSIQYDRLPFLRYKGLTNGIGRITNIFPPELFKEGLDLLKRLNLISENTAKSHSNRSKNVLRLLMKHAELEGDVNNGRVRRGYYLCLINKSLKGYKQKWEPPHSIEEAIEYWRKRWLVKRL